MDVGFWGGVVRGHQSSLPALFEAGVFGFTCAVAASDDDTGAVSANALKETMAALARLGVPLVAHAGPAEHARAAPHARRWVDRVRHPSRGARRYAAYLDQFPKAAENEPSRR